MGGKMRKNSEEVAGHPPLCYNARVLHTTAVTVHAHIQHTRDRHPYLGIIGEMCCYLSGPLTAFPSATPADMEQETLLLSLGRGRRGRETGDF